LKKTKIQTIQPESSKLLIPALALARYAPRGATLVAGILMVEIGASFGTPVGITSQLGTIRSIVATISALTMGILSVRYSSRILLNMGIAIAMISALGCIFSSNFGMMFVSYTMGGIAWAMIYPMTIALVGDLFTLEKRAVVISWVAGIPAVITVFGAPIIGYIGEWRHAFAIFVFPIALTSMILTLFSVPETEGKVKDADLLIGFKAVLSNKSAIACLVAQLMYSMAWIVIVMLSSSFLRQHHLVSTGLASLSYSGFALACFIGLRVGSKAVNMIGRKPSSVLLLAAFSFFSILFVLVPTATLAIIFGVTTSLFAGMFQTALNALTMEQLPGIRGSLMSLSSACARIGSALCTGIGGVILLTYGWLAMGSLFGSMGLLASFLLFNFATDPTISSCSG